MRIDIKKFKENICKAAGHEWKSTGILDGSQICTRCNKKGSIFKDSEPGIRIIPPSTSSVKLMSDDALAGDVSFDLENNCMVIYDGQKWIVFGK